MFVTDLKKRLLIEIMPVYFLKGRDNYLVEWAIKIFSALVDESFADFNLSVYPDAENMKDIIASLNTVPMFSDRRVVVVKSGANLDEGDKSRLESYLKNPADFSVLVMVDDLVADEDAAKTASPLMPLYKYGDVVDCGKVDAPQFSEWIVAYVKRNGCSISSSAVYLLANFTSRNMSRAVSEADKLCAYAEGKEITQEMIYELVSPDNEYKVYALTNALTDGNNDGALNILQALLDRGESAGGLLSLIESQYRRMLIAKVSPVDNAAGGKVTWQMTNARKLAAKFSAVALKDLVDKIVGLEYRYKSGAMDDVQALHEAFSFLLKKN